MKIYILARLFTTFYFVRILVLIYDEIAIYPYKGEKKLGIYQVFGLVGSNMRAQHIE